MSDPPAASDPRPRPQYGEYAPPGWVSPNPDAAPPPPAATPVAIAPPRTWDRPLTMVLLGVGFLGMSFGVYGGLNLQLVLEQAGAMQGIPVDLPSWTGTAGILVAVSHVVLYLVAFLSGLSLLRRGKLAFWAPLACGVVAALIYHGTTGALGIAAGIVPALQ